MQQYYRQNTDTTKFKFEHSDYRTTRLGVGKLRGMRTYKENY